MEREKYWDSLKFILIFFVVYGHIVPHYLGNSHFNMAIYNLVYFFHMPLFVFVSGRFSHIRDRRKYKSGIIRLIETYVVFQIVRTFVSVLFENEEFTIDCIITPSWTLWYLISLSYWRLMVYVIHGKYGQYWIQRHCNMLILASFCISIMAGFIPIDYPFGIQRTLSFLPFFVLGFYSVNTNVMKIKNRIHPLFAIFILFSVFFVLYFLIYENLDYIHHGSIPYWAEDGVHTFYRLGLRCLFFPIAIIISLSVMRITPSFSKFAEWGRATLFIYIFHSFALRELLFPFADNIAVMQHPLMLFCHAIIITAGLLLLSHSKFMNNMITPISYIKSRFKALGSPHVSSSDRWQ